MLFPSAEFVLVFLPIALLGFHLIGRFGRKPALAWLTIISIAFYAKWRLEFVPLLVGSITFNYLCGTLIAKTADRPGKQKLILVLGITGNLSLLMFYKYLFPMLAFLDEAGIIHHHWEMLLLPLGISFFTFTQIGYLIDLGQGQALPQGFLSYTMFVTFFPHLIAGPILHHKEIMPQITEERPYGLKAKDLDVGFSWFLLGLLKKLLIADQIAPLADAAFAHPQGLAFTAAWSGALAYALQLYFDFSGYSDMAVGLARMFSIEFPLNFNSPYKAASIIDFWQRWHMTLTRYITLYIYNPLALWVVRRRTAAGKKSSRKAIATPGGFANMIAMPMMITMTLAGVWHGAGLQYVVFGVLHGVFLTANHAWRIFTGKAPETTPRWKQRVDHVTGVLLTFCAVLTAMMFFRAASVSDALAILRGMTGWNGFAPASGTLSQALDSAHGLSVWLSQLLNNDAYQALIFIPILLFVVWTLPNTQELIGRYSGWHIPIEVRSAVYSVVLYLLLFRSAKPQSFMYFQF